MSGVKTRRPEVVEDDVSSMSLWARNNTSVYTKRAFESSWLNNFDDHELKLCELCTKNYVCIVQDGKISCVCVWGRQEERGGGVLCVIQRDGKSWQSAPRILEIAAPARNCISHSYPKKKKTQTHPFASKSSRVGPKRHFLTLYRKI